MARRYFTVLAAAAAVALGGCAMQQGGRAGAGGPMGAHGGHHGMPGPGAMAKISPTQGNQASGVATFHEAGGQLMVHVRVTGLTPNAEHGFHVHERGDCSAPDATSAGGHFNPTGKPHGPQGGEHHAGDLPNLKANAQGNAEMRVTLSGLTLSRGETSVLDRALVIHAQPDDYRSQPAGNSGPRIACGVISSPVPPPR
ncbi:superoxide dismutase family protein [Caldimonas tepidiphila]|uniref:superoxide dismutase family protein n=1 Tax=Caldimonas tepidiphila TaxID=2315841 RepID=UPI000E5AA52F|nr:superoxide dismutase family protein [Caldimonas tepidiphila]